MKTILEECRIGMRVFVALLLILAGMPTPPARAQYQWRNAGEVLASAYAYTSAEIISGNTATGTQTILACASGVTADGHVYAPFSVLAPIIVDLTSATNTETVTPTGVSYVTPPPPSAPSNQQCANITASFSFTHGGSLNTNQIRSATCGLAEAINDVYQASAPVTVDDSWGCASTKAATFALIPPVGSVGVIDKTGPSTQIWTATQGAATLLAAPSTLTATTVGFGINGANTTGGAYTGTSTYNVNIAYLAPDGQEGPASATFSGLTAGTGTTNQIGIAAPAASAGAVAYLPYISLASGTYNLSYQVPVTSSVCTLSKLLPPGIVGCAVANATYGQSGSNAVISALTVNTAPLHLLATTASTTSAYIGTPNGRTTYVWAPHSAAIIPGVPATMQAFTVAAATATTVPGVIGTVTVPAGVMNQAGRTFQLCGNAIMASTGSTSTVENIEFLWDAAGSDTTGAPVIVGKLNLTATDAASAQVVYSFCENLETTVSGAGVTAGSIFPYGGYLDITTGVAGTPLGVGNDSTAAAVGSLNLAGTGGNSTRIHVVYLHTTGTDAAGVALNNLTITAI